jgi:hypothetical protein
MKKTLTFLIGYTMIAGATYGYAFHDEMRFQNKHFPNWPAMNRATAIQAGCVAALLWPIYWPFHGGRVMWPNDPSSATAGPKTL